MESQWQFTGLGAMVGWNYAPAIDLLIHGYGVRGEELLAETERFKIMEMTQMQIAAEERKRKQALADAKKRGSRVPGTEDIEHVDGDLDDFMEDAIIPDEEE